MSNHFYITTTLPYVNGAPHIGFALELIRADIIARSQKLRGKEVFFNTGTDEHGIKIFRKAKDLGISPEEYVNQISELFRKLIPDLGIMPEINFIRTTNPDHIYAAQEFWKLVDKNGYIYKKNYSVKYCIGCELEKTESELVNGKCPLHPLQELEIIEEENYFFKFSAFKNKLLELYNSKKDFVIPESRQHEIKSFVSMGLEDFSISRLAVKMPWGIPVPGDPKQVMYVWFDALINYISAIGWPKDMVKFNQWWEKTGGVVQYCGKDNLRQQAAMWQAMLIAGGLNHSKTIVIDGFITGEGGIKMSKSLGNVVEPDDILKEYGVDALRYFVSRELHPFEDGVFTHDKFKQAYNAHLANGLGNLVSRVMKMAEANSVKYDEKAQKAYKESTAKDSISKYDEAIGRYDLMTAMNAVWEIVTEADKLIQERQPFKKIKTDKEGAKRDISELLSRLALISELLDPFLPSTAKKIKELVHEGVMPEAPVFMRK